MNVTLTPYLTDYKSAKAATDAYHAGKDFIINAFGMRPLPINKSQCEAEGFKVTIRYNKLQRTVEV